jgi:hypothetical protein
LLVPLPTLDALQLALQAFIALLLGADLLDGLVAVGDVQLLDELRDEVLVLQRLLHRRQRRAGLLALPGVRAFAVGFRVFAVAALLELDLAPQPFQIKGAQRIRTEAAALVVVVAGDVGVLLQQVRDAAKDGGADAIDAEVVEQQERLEGGVGRCRHSPVARRTEGRWR